MASAPFMPSLNHIPVPLITLWIPQPQTGRSLFTFLSPKPCLGCQSWLPSAVGTELQAQALPAWTEGNTLGKDFQTQLMGWAPLPKQLLCQGLPGNGSTFTLWRFLFVFCTFLFCYLCNEDGEQSGVRALPPGCAAPVDLLGWLQGLGMCHVLRGLSRSPEGPWLCSAFPT